jgi:tetratricopeptide (TPR) repeat protein
LALGLATGMRPNLLLAGLAALAVPWARALPHPARLARSAALGLLVGLAPVTLTNLAASGSFTLLTLSGGHNLYIGHNPAAQPQYALPAALDGDIFASMKALAEEVEGRSLRPEEVSSYYSRRAASHALRNPGREVSLAARRALLLVNDFEATTYANLEYQRHYSAVLRWTPTFAWLLALALPGMLLAWGRSRAHLWIPVLVAALSVLAFFYIARLRVVMIPSLAIFAGAAVARGVELGRTRARQSVAVAALVAVAGFAVAKLPFLRSDTSNDWNKAGGTLRVMERFEEAEAALERARAANPDNVSTYLNLAALYRDTGRLEEERTAMERARTLSAGESGERVDFMEAVRGPGS